MNLLPFVTIIIPVRNEAHYIGSCLRSILEQDYPHERMEILVADGMSTDSTQRVVEEIATTASCPVRCIPNPGRIVPTGMNLALRQARGEIIIRVDGHCQVLPGFLSNNVRHLLAGEAEGVGGPMRAIGETPLAETIAVAMSSLFGVGGSAFRTLEGLTLYTDTVPFPAYGCAITRRVGLYDEELVRNQDDEYNYRIREAGGRLLLANDVRSVYYSRGSLGKLWKQYFQYGLWKVRVLQKHPRQMSLRQFVPLAFVLALAGAALAALLSSWGGALLGLVLGAYMAANLAASIYTAVRRGWRFLPLLPVCFAILHLSYGLGFLAGLGKFWNRWNDKAGRVPAWSSVGEQNG